MSIFSHQSCSWCTLVTEPMPCFGSKNSDSCCRMAFLSGAHRLIRNLNPLPSLCNPSLGAPEFYDKHVRNVCLFAEGPSTGVEQSLAARMDQAPPKDLSRLSSLRARLRSPPNNATYELTRLSLSLYLSISCSLVVSHLLSQSSGLLPRLSM